MYYFVPKQAERPVYSYRLSIVHFWALISLYIWAGPHHLHYTALPDWGGGVQGCAAPVLPFAGTVKLFRRAGSAALDRIGHGANGLDQAEQEQRFQGWGVIRPTACSLPV